MMDGTFTLDDMLIQLEQVNKMGPLSRYHEDVTRWCQYDEEHEYQ